MSENDTKNELLENNETEQTANEFVLEDFKLNANQQAKAWLKFMSF